VIYGILPPLPTTRRFTFAGDVQNVQRGMIPRIYGRSYAIEADLVVPDSGAEGVIVANADFIGGFGLWVDADGILRHTYSFLGVDTYKQVADRPLPAGEISVRMLFSRLSKPGSGGARHALRGDDVVGRAISRTPFHPYRADVGGPPVVDLDYEDKAPAFTGTVKVDLAPMTHERNAARAQALGNVRAGRRRLRVVAPGRRRGGFVGLTACPGISYAVAGSTRCWASTPAWCGRPIPLVLMMSTLTSAIA
jgi:arylsulfatase